MKRTVIDTEDNSKTLLINNTDVTYHSRHGALTESIHVFIKNGISLLDKKKSITIFEMGLGTGLNTILAYEFGKRNKININYHAIEKHPVSTEELKALNIEKNIENDSIDIFSTIHQSKWNTPITITPDFTFQKYESDILDFNIKTDYYDIIFFDAFGPKFQPDLWKKPILEKMYKSLKTKGVFMTYCAQGQFKRDLKAVGFSVENLPGPPGKREITRGIKL